MAIQALSNIKSVFASLLPTPLPSAVASLFQEKLQLNDSRAFQSLWDQALATRRITWDPKETLGDERIAQIEQGLKETLIYHGKGFSYTSLETSLKLNPIIDYLLSYGTLPHEEIKKSAKEIFLQSDPVRLLQMQEELRLVLQSCSDNLPAEGAAEEPVFEAFVGNLLSLLPYSYPSEGATFTVPVKVEGRWKTAVYTIDRKIMLKSWFTSPIPAYGFTSPNGPPLLSFIGTTYPGGEGSLATFLADFTPGVSVGHAPYHFGKEQIAAWLKDKKNVQLFGTSLGGALCLQTERHHPEEIGKVNVYNPPGLYYWDWKGETQTEINIYYQENDFVATMGYFPEGPNVNVYRVIPSEQTNALEAHLRIHTGADQVTFLKSDPAYENQRIPRKLLTAFHFLFSFTLVFGPLALGYLIYSILSRPVYYVLSKI